MQIGELARQAGVEVETVRYYEKEGLLPEPVRSSSGYRQYAPQHLDTLRFIRHCRSLDMSLAEIRTLDAITRQPAMSCEGVNRLIDEHLLKVEQQMRALTALKGQLQALRESCSSDRDSADCGILRSLLGAAHGEPCACHESLASPGEKP